MPDCESFYFGGQEIYEENDHSGHESPEEGGGLINDAENISMLLRSTQHDSNDDDRPPVHSEASHNKETLYDHWKGSDIPHELRLMW